MVQLVEKNKVDEDKRFEKHTSVEINSANLDIFIEKQMHSEMSNHTVIIDARTWTLFKKLKGSLFLNFK